MVTYISGIVVEGTRSASGIAKFKEIGGTLRAQYPFFKRGGSLNFRSMHPGTINISIAPREFRILVADYAFYNIQWHSAYPAENFSFVRCVVLNRDKCYPGYIYFPHPETKPGRFPGFSILEIITHFVPGISYGQQIGCMFSNKQIAIL